MQYNLRNKGPMVNNSKKKSAVQPSTSQSNQEQTNKIVQKKNVEEIVHEKDVPNERDPYTDVPNITQKKRRESCK